MSHTGLIWVSGLDNPTTDSKVRFGTSVHYKEDVMGLIGKAGRATTCESRNGIGTLGRVRQRTSLIG